MRNIFHYCKTKSEQVSNADWINHFRNKWELLCLNRKDFTLLIILLSFFITILHVNHIVILQNKHNENTLIELKKIKIVLEDIALSPIYQNQQIMQSTFDNEMKAMKQTLTDLSTKISSQKEELNSHLNTLQQSISQPKEEKPYLDANALPFHVISVDVMDGQSYVSIDYANHVLPLTIGDWLGGWQVVQADEHSAMVEFVNVKKQYVKVSLKEVVSHA